MPRPLTSAAAAAALLAAGALSGCASDHSVGMHDAADVLGMTVAEASGEVHEGVHVEPIDLGHRYLDPAPEQPRPAVPPEGWRVIAQCEQTLDGALTVGVLTEEEYRAITQGGLTSGISLNGDRIFLNCPEDRDEDEL
ncbi:hypothetical protein [Corynebacterium sp. 335C]